MDSVWGVQGRESRRACACLPARLFCPSILHGSSSAFTHTSPIHRVAHPVFLPSSICLPLRHLSAIHPPTHPPFLLSLLSSFLPPSYPSFHSIYHPFTCANIPLTHPTLHLPIHSFSPSCHPFSVHLFCPFVHSAIVPSTQRSLSASCVYGPVLDAGDTGMTQTQALPHGAPDLGERGAQQTYTCSEADSGAERNVAGREGCAEKVATDPS